MSHLKEYLDYYKTLKEPGYAVLVTGEWGVGKTFQVKQIIPPDDMIYVSLFGVSSVEQLNAEVIAAAFPNMSKFQKLADNSAGLIGNITKMPKAAKAVPSVMNAFLRRQVNPARMLIFDDLERTSLKIDDAFGAINSFIEHEGFRVVIIAHDDKVSKKLKKRKEKIIGQTVRVEPKPAEAFDNFCEKVEDKSARSFCREHRSSILDMCDRSKTKSLRVLRHVIEDVARLHGALTEQHLQHQTAMEELVSLFAAFQLEVREGRLQSKDVSARSNAKMNYLIGKRFEKKGDKTTEPPLVQANERYPNIDLESNLLNDDVLCDMLFYGRFSKQDIAKSLNNSAYFLVPGKEPPWKVVIASDKLDDAVVDKALDDINRQFRKREIVSPGEMLHVFSLRLMMAENSIVEQSMEELTQENCQYIDDLVAQGRLPARGTDFRWFDSFDSGHEDYGYWVSKDAQGYFRKVWDHLIDAQKNVFQSEAPGLVRDMLKKAKSDPKGEFLERVCPTNNGPNQYAYIPVLHHIEAADFVDWWLGLPREHWRTIKYALQGRYESQVRNDSELKEENPWALSVLKELKKRANSEKGFKALRIERIIPSVLENLHGFDT